MTLYLVIQRPKRRHAHMLNTHVMIVEAATAADAKRQYMASENYLKPECNHPPDYCAPEAIPIVAGDAFWF